MSISLRNLAFLGALGECLGIVIFDNADSTNNDDEPLDNIRDAAGEEINTGHPSLDQPVCTVDIMLKKSNTPTGNGELRIYDAAETLQKTVGSPLDVSTLTTSYVKYSFESTGTKHILAAGDKVVFFYSGGTASNTVLVGRSTDDISNANATNRTKAGPTWVDVTVRDAQLTIKR